MFYALTRRAVSARSSSAPWLRIWTGLSETWPKKLIYELNMLFLWFCGCWWQSIGKFWEFLVITTRHRSSEMHNLIVRSHSFKSFKWYWCLLDGSLLRIDNQSFETMLEATHGFLPFVANHKLKTMWKSTHGFLPKITRHNFETISEWIYCHPHMLPNSRETSLGTWIYSENTIPYDFD